MQKRPISYQQFIKDGIRKYEHQYDELSKAYRRFCEDPNWNGTIKELEEYCKSVDNELQAIKENIREFKKNSRKLYEEFCDEEYK